MNVCVALEQRFVRRADGSVWSRGEFTAAFWRRYLDVFDHVRCVARVARVARVEGTWHRADVAGVSFADVPYYIGPAEFLRHAAEIRHAVQREVRAGTAFILRVPGTLATLAWGKLHALRYPYGVEVVGDPFDAFAPGAVQHPLRPLIRWYATRGLQQQCRHAAAASYVTAEALQRRYPAACPAVVASSIDLLEDAFVPAPRRFSAGDRPSRLLFVGSLEQHYKAPDVLIRAVARNLARGQDLHLSIVGDGRLRPQLESLAASVGGGDRIRFVGHLPGPAAVRAELDRADLFVLPSKTEGLPRAMVEAMARALPCIGSSVGGIPELLLPEALVPPGDETALADRLFDVLREPEQLARMSAHNLEAASGYGRAVLQARRVGCYRLLRGATEAWLGSDRRLAIV